MLCEQVVEYSYEECSTSTGRVEDSHIVEYTLILGVGFYLSFTVVFFCDIFFQCVFLFQSVFVFSEIFAETILDDILDDISRSIEYSIFFAFRHFLFYVFLRINLAIVFYLCSYLFDIADRLFEDMSEYLDRELSTVFREVVSTECDELFYDTITDDEGIDTAIRFEESAIVSIGDTDRAISPIDREEEFFEHFPWSKSELLRSIDTDLEFILREKSSVFTKTDEYYTVDDTLSLLDDFSIPHAWILFPDVSHELKSKSLIFFIELF